MTILYVHGFASTGNSSKATQIEAIVGERVLAPNLSHRPAADVARLETLIREEAVTTVVGSSLGGFYALYLAQRTELRVILVNPALNAHELLIDRRGTVQVYETGEEFEWTQAQIDELREISAFVDAALDPHASRVTWSKVLVLLARHDERIDTATTLARLPATARVVVDEVQDHRFGDLAPYADAIRELVRGD